MNKRLNYNRIFGLPVFALAISVMIIILWSCNTGQGNTQKAKQVVANKAQGFMAGEVKLLDGPFKESQDAEAKYLLELELDRLLAPFRTEAGLEPKAKAYPGWETNSLPGVACSFYLSGISRLYKATGDEEYLRRMNYILDEMELCQNKLNGLLLGSRGAVEIFKRLENEYYSKFNDWSQGHGEPYYVMEKLFSGLIDAYRIGGSTKALKIAVNLADWLEIHMSKISDEDLELIMECEYGGMNWVLSDMYVITGNRRYLAMAERWHDKPVIIPMTEGKDVLTGIHANTQFPKMSGLAARFPYTGDTTELYGARFFWDKVVNHRSYATGGNSESEFFSAADSLSNTLTPYTEENCNEYNMLKLTSLLFKIEPRVEYASYLERTLFNHTLSAQNPMDGEVCYHIPLMPGAEREYHSLFESFSCCVCSSMDSYTRHAEYIYAHDESNLYINLFIASELIWKEKGMKMMQETRFPFEDQSAFKFEFEKETDMGLKIRYPDWLAAPMTIKINDETQQIDPQNGYIGISRKWKSGDRVEIKLPMNIRTESMADDKNRIALFYGPVLLAGAYEPVIADKLTLNHLVPAIVPGDLQPDNWLVKSEAPLTFTTDLIRPAVLMVKPLFLLKTGPFSVYWQKMTEKEWKKWLESEENRKQDLLQLERITIDKVTAGNDESEKAHSLTGNSGVGNGNSAILMGVKWRSANDSEGFSYIMKVPSDSKAALHCRFMGRHQYETWDCVIKVDTTTIARLKRDKDDSYPVAPFNYTYQLPVELIKGKENIKVTFVVNVPRKMPRLMEVRIIRQN